MCKYLVVGVVVSNIPPTKSQIACVTTDIVKDRTLEGNPLPRVIVYKKSGGFALVSTFGLN